MSHLTHALKEWAVAVNALEQGETIMLLRKGGIKEEGNRFSVKQSQVLLYPTYEHQKSHLLKPQYAQQVQPVPSGWHPETVRIGSWAEITNIFAVTTAETLSALLPYHIWNEQFAVERFKWKPKQPLYVLLLRTYRLLQVTEIPYQSMHGGCRSWIELQEEFPVTNSVPVLEEAEYLRQIEVIRREIQS
jgi:hypothetical protein